MNVNMHSADLIDGFVALTIMLTALSVLIAVVGFSISKALTRIGNMVCGVMYELEVNRKLTERALGGISETDGEGQTGRYPQGNGDTGEGGGV